MTTYLLDWMGALGFVSVPAAGLFLIALASKGRLLRCPETGGLGLVEISAAEGANGEPARTRVRGCDLWPQRRECNRGCLAGQP